MYIGNCSKLWRLVAAYQMLSCCEAILSIKMGLTDTWQYSWGLPLNKNRFIEHRIFIARVIKYYISYISMLQILIVLFIAT